MDDCDTTTKLVTKITRIKRKTSSLAEHYQSSRAQQEDQSANMKKRRRRRKSAFRPRHDRRCRTQLSPLLLHFKTLRKQESVVWRLPGAMSGNVIPDF